MSVEKNIKEAFDEGKTVIGRGRVMKLLKAGGLESVVYASNCTPTTVKDLEYYARISKIQTEKFNGDASKLSQVCRKPFNITILGIKK